MSEPKTIESVADLLHEVTNWQCYALEPETAMYGIWFRGQANESHALLPGVERPQFLAKASKRWGHLDEQHQQLNAERFLNRELIRLGVSFFGEPVDLVRAYFMAQHYGLPTRLLDWTTNPLAALFFACQEAKDSKGSPAPGRLFVTKHNQIGRKNPRLPANEYGKEVKATVSYVFGGSDEPPVSPAIIPVVPTSRFPRMMRQGACFTLHMPAAEKLVFDEATAPGCGITCRVIPAGVKSDILAQLRQLGVSWFSLFTDLDYLMRDVSESF